MSISRRQILFRLAGLASIARASGASAQKRRYRVAATISVLGAPVITRQNVGTAFVMLHEIDEAERRIVRLHFAGESNAERAHGLVYAGSMEESVIEHRSTPLEARYFGFVTAPEDQVAPFLRFGLGQKHKAAFVALEVYPNSGCGTRTR